MKSLSDTVVPKYNPSSAAAKEYARSIRTRTPNSPASSLLPGNIVFTNYVAVTRGVYDYNPCVLVIRANKHHIFGINVNWMTRLQKVKMIKYFVDRKLHETSRLQRAVIFRQLKRLRSPRSAYRLYHRKAFAKPKLFNLDVYDLYQMMTKNIRVEREVDK